jgi:hypothetical protein
LVGRAIGVQQFVLFHQRPALLQQHRAAQIGGFAVARV